MKIIILLLLISPLFASEERVLFGTSRPPYIFENKGLVFDFFKDIYQKELKRRYSFSNGSNKRINKELSKNEFDVIVEVQKSNQNYYYSKPFIFYQNYIITKNKPLKDFYHWSDLRDKNVCAWQDAKISLGKEFAAIVPTMSKYKEFPRQYDQVKSWLLDSCEYIVIDKNIFLWWEKELKDTISSKRKISEYKSYFIKIAQPKLWWYVAFKDKKSRDSFDKILNSKDIEKEIKRYMNNYIGN